MEFNAQESDRFADFLNNLTTRKNIKIIFCSSYPTLGIEKFQFMRLKGLCNADAVQLFLQKIPSDDRREELCDLVELKELNSYTEDLKMEEKLPIDLKLAAITTTKDREKNAVCVKNYLMRHPLITSLGGHPLAISMISSRLFHNSLKEMFEKMMQKSTSLFGKHEDAFIKSLDISLSVI